MIKSLSAKTGIISFVFVGTFLAGLFTPTLPANVEAQEESLLGQQSTEITEEGQVLDAVDEACKALRKLDPDAKCGPAAENKLIGVAKVVINILSLIIGIASVIVIIVAGFRFVVSGGESANVANARNSIIYAIVGIVIVVFAQVIVAFVLNKL